MIAFAVLIFLTFGISEVSKELHGDTAPVKTEYADPE